MMKWIFSGMILLSVLFGLMNGRMEEVSGAALTGCGSAVELTIALAGSMCLWSGLMNIARESGLTQRISAAFTPVIRLLFRGLDSRGKAAQAICLNLSANLLGLGNAATPLGITAMKELQQLNPDRKTATDHMVMFAVLNTASLQLIPTTTALLRMRAGSPTPMDILPAVLAASFVSVLSGVAVAKALAGRETERKAGRQKIPMKMRRGG